jgi:hypothetical protein
VLRDLQDGGQPESLPGIGRGQFGGDRLGNAARRNDCPTLRVEDGTRPGKAVCPVGAGSDSS